ncbi:MAG: phenylalanine--tRNA ligase subunit beta [Acidobacteria bacterium 37-71-11]|nr:MAG: phenylalanine--tRNA ligase subunit beta [Acidobacteria bacterium 37-71-11]
MKFSLAWLRDHLDGDTPADELAAKLTAAGMNVELREPATPIDASGNSLPASVGGSGGHLRREGGGVAQGPPEPDEIWDVDVTANRPDAMNHRGLAREGAAAGCGALKPLPSGVTEGAAKAGDLAKVTVEDAAGCPRYCARVVRGVTIAPSPAWLAERLERCGVRPVNNVVDATNYVLLDVGQPLHAFDLARLAGHEIRVRRARAGERITTLDGVERTLNADDLVIADASRAVGIAGVMGGANSEISDATRDVLIESATFDPRRVRATARRLGLKTEASHRFERGSDRAMARTAADLAAELIARLAGGEVAAGVLDSNPEMPAPREIAFSLARLSAFVGCAIPSEFAVKVLAALELAPRVAGDIVTCTVPPWRMDLELAEDLYEEVLRLFGYEKVPSVLPSAAAKPGRRLGSWPLTERARDALAGVGAAEAFTYSFVSEAAEAAAAGSPLAERGGIVAVANPLSARMAVMRRSLLAGLAEAAGGNLRRGAESVLLGEVGRVFFARDGAVAEEERLALALAGSVGDWDAVRAADFLDLKGVVEAVLSELGVTATEWRPASAAVLAAGEGAEVGQNGRVIAVAGRFADAAAALDLPAPVWVAEIDLTAAATAAHVPAFEPLPRFPAVAADLTVRHKLALHYAELVAAVTAAGPAWLESVSPVVRYRGEGVAPDEVKTTVRLIYRHPERSLTQDEVNAAHFALMDRLGRELAVSFS